MAVPTPTPLQVSHIHTPQVSDFNFHAKMTNDATTTSPNVVIDLELLQNEGNHDQDCIFVKTQKISMPKGKETYVDVEAYIIQDRELGKTPKLEKGIDIVLVQCVDDYDDDDEVRIVSVKPSPNPKLSASNKRRSIFSSPSVFEVGESANSQSQKSIQIDLDVDVDVDVDVVEISHDPNPMARRFTCEICADIKPLHESFNIKGCSHSYCLDCIKTYVASKLQDGAHQINCPVPSCHGVLEPEYCREILPFEVFDRWGKLLCESVILASQKFYCPFKDCSALLIDDGGEKVTKSECPSCYRLFCAQCKVGWHHGIECSEYQTLKKDEREKEDIMLRNLAKTKEWQRCPKCSFYVEKSAGCLYMVCRCGAAFCYKCGSLSVDHRYHYCRNCTKQ